MTNINNWNKNNILKFSIDHTSLEEDLFDFPVLLNITESSGKNNYDCSDFFEELVTHGSEEDFDKYAIFLNFEDASLKDLSFNESIINTTGTVYFFKNDTLVPTTLITAPAGSSNVCTNTIIGNSANFTRTFDGTIFEVRISNTIRSDGWLKASYHSIMDELLSYNEVETYVETPTQYYAYEGYVKNKATPVERKVLLYERTTGLLMDATTSDNQGQYLLQTPYNTEHFIVVLDNIADYKFNPLIKDRILPNGS